MSIILHTHTHTPYTHNSFDSNASNTLNTEMQDLDTPKEVSQAIRQANTDEEANIENGNELQQQQREQQQQEPENHTNEIITNSNNSTDLTFSDTEDDYMLSDDEELNRILSRETSNHHHHGLPSSGSMVDHAQFFAEALSHALDSIDIDRSLVLQAQISGKLNNENQKIIEKKEILIEKLKNIQLMYGKNFGLLADGKESRVDKMKKDISFIENRITKLMHGGSETKSSIPFFKNKSNMGVEQKYPIEFNQAKDKVIERQIDDDDDNEEIDF